jgi:hypothetical protein
MRHAWLTRFSRAGPDWWRNQTVSRRRFVGITAGAAGGVLSGGLWTPARSDDQDDDDFKARRQPCPEQNPIPHLNNAVIGIGGFRFFFPGPSDGSFSAVDNESHVQPNGRDPSTLFDFDGVLGQADLEMTGVGTDLTTGARSDYGFHADMRFMAGKFVGTDGRVHKGAFAFI